MWLNISAGSYVSRQRQINNVAQTAEERLCQRHVENGQHENDKYLHGEKARNICLNVA
jgi:hypothetical protein